MKFIKVGLDFTGEDCPNANLMLFVMGAFAEFKRIFMGSSSQRENIALARQRGAHTER